MEKRPEGWKHISIDGNNIYASQNTPVEGLGTQNQKIASGRGVEVLGGNKKVVLSVEVKGAGDRDGERTSGMDGTNGGGDVDSKQRSWL